MRTTAAPSAWPAGSTKVGRMPDERVAVCLAGWHGGLIQSDRGLSIRRNLVDSLGATLLLALSYRREDNCHSDVTCGLGERLSGLQPWARLGMAPRRTTKEWSATLEALPHWPAILAPFNTKSRKDTFCKRKPPPSGALGDHVSPYHCRISKGWSNTFLMPVLGSPRGVALHDLADASGCLRELRAAEAAAAGSGGGGWGSDLATRTLPFDRVVFSALSHVWLAPHPPLTLLDGGGATARGGGDVGSGCVWMPHGGDSGGLTTRHAVLRRADAEAYLGRLDRVLDGRLLQEHPLGRGAVSAIAMERHLAAVLKQRNLSTCRFAATAFLGCDNLTLARLTGLPKKRRFPLAAAAGGAAVAEVADGSAAAWAAIGEAGTLPPVGGVGGGVGSEAGGGEAAATILLEGRNHQEMDEVIEHAMALQLPGARMTALTRPAAAVAGGFWVLADRRAVGIAAPAAHAAAFFANLTRARKLKRRVTRTLSPLIVWEGT